MKNDIYYINWHFEMCHRAKVNKKVNASKKCDRKAWNKYLLKLITLAAVRKLKKKSLSWKLTFPKYKIKLVVFELKMAACTCCMLNFIDC